jgi:hypothetical protein
LFQRGCTDGAALFQPGSPPARRPWNDVTSVSIQSAFSNPASRKPRALSCEWIRLLDRRCAGKNEGKPGPGKIFFAAATVKFVERISRTTNLARRYDASARSA